MNADVDYKLRYENNKDASTTNNKAKVIISGNGNFSGEYTLEFEIQPHSINESDINVQMTKSFEFTGGAVNPHLLITMDSYELNSTEKVDYTVQYQKDTTGQGNWSNVNAQNCIEKGKYRIVITGQGNFKDVRNEEFEITAFALSGDKIVKENATPTGEPNTWALADIEFDWKLHMVEPVLKLNLEDGSQKTLGGQDYDLSYDTADFVNVNTIKITVKGKGDYSGTLYFTYKIVPANISNTGRFNATAPGFTDNMEVPFKNADYTFTFTISDSEKPAQESKSVTFAQSYLPADTKSVGKVTITLTGNGNFTGTITKTFTIKAVNFDGDGNVTGDGKGELPNLTIGELQNFTYDGKAHKQGVTLSFGEYSLVADNDYEITYTNDGGFINAQEITMSIKGKGNFSFTLSRSYKIEKVNITSNLVTSTFTDDVSETRVFTGDPYTIRYKLTYLVDETDLGVTSSVKYSQNGSEENANINAGNVTMTIEGTGNYTGTITKTFVITPKNLADFSLADFTYNPNVLWQGVGTEAKQDDLTLHYNGRDYKEDALTFSLSYENNNQVTNDAKVHLTGRGNFVGTFDISFRIVTKILDAQSIEVKVIYPEGKEGYSYTGKAIVPELQVTVSDGAGSVTVPAKDYMIVYRDAHTEVGDHEFYINLIGGYAGQSSNVTFKIIPLEFDGSGNVSDGTEGVPGLTISELKNVLYDGKDHKQSVEIKFGEYVLVETQDYSVTYQSNGFVNAQTVTLNIVGQGNFKFNMTRSYEIEKVDIASTHVTTQFSSRFDEVRVFTGNAYTIDFTMQYLVDGQDVGVTRTVKYTQNGVDETNANVYAGTVTMTIEGTGNYMGTITNTFVISPKNLSEFGDQDFVYSSSVEWNMGTVEQPELKLRYNSKEYSAGDLTFELSYENNTSINDDATIHVVGKGNFSGEKTLKFRIVAQLVAQDNIVVEQVHPEGYYYTGSEIEPEIRVYVVAGERRTEIQQSGYDIVYQDDHTNVGAHKFTVRLKGDYAGDSKEQTFNILAISLNDAGQGQSLLDMQAPADVTYDGLAHTLVPTLSIKAGEEAGYVLKQGQDFTVEYYKQDKGTETETDFINAHTIYFKVSAHGTNFTGAVWGSYQILAKDLSDTNEVTMEYQSIWAFTGQPVTPDVTVTYRSEKNTIILKKDQNFKLSYANNTNVTLEATITVSCLESDQNYIGSRTLTFSIGSISLEDFQGVSIDEIPQQKYLARAIEPEVVVKLNGQAVDNSGNKQYTVTFKRDTARYPDLSENDHTNVGFVTVIITATDTGNFTGTTETTFEIVPQILADATVQLKGASGAFADWVDGTQYTFLGTEIKPGSKSGELKVTIAGFTTESGELIEVGIGTEVSLAYSNALGTGDTINVGNKKLTISAVSSNFIGSKELTYQIVALNLSNPGTDGAGQQITVEVVGWKDELVYNQGREVLQPYDENEANGYSLRVNGVIMDPSMYSVNYTYTREGEKVVVGPASGTFVSNLSAGGNFTGSILKTFEIIKADVVIDYGNAETDYYIGSKFADIFRAKDKTDNVTLVEGTFYVTQNGRPVEALELGTFTYNVQFTPTDSHNYNGASGTIEIDAKPLVVVRISAHASIDYIDGHAFDANTLRVEKIYNSGASEVMSSSEYKILGLVDNLYLSYENGFMVVYNENEELYDTIFVRPTRLGGEDGVEVRSDKGFAEGISMTVEKISDMEEIKQLISDVALEKLSNIHYLYRVVFYKNGEKIEDPDFDYEVWINLNRLERGHIPYAVQGDDVQNLADLADSSGYVQLQDVSEMIVLVSVKHSIWTNWIFWIILIAVIIFLLILTILILVYLREQRKRENQRKLVAKTNG